MTYLCRNLHSVTTLQASNLVKISNKYRQLIILKPTLHAHYTTSVPERALENKLLSRQRSTCFAPECL